MTADCHSSLDPATSKIYAMNMPSKPTAILSTSSWTFHPLLGSPKITGVTDTSLPEVKDSVWPELLEALANFGASSIDVCHFHLSSRDPSQQRELADAFRRAGVQPQTFLVDAGNLAGDDESHLEWIQSWFADASRLGCQSIRVLGGEDAFSEAGLEKSVSRFKTLAPAAKAQGLRLLTENFKALLRDASVIANFLERLGGEVGFLLDFGNLKAESYYEDLERLAPLAEACHAKAIPKDGSPDSERFERSLELLRASGFSGPIALIGNEKDMGPWDHLQWMKDKISERFELHPK